MFLKAGMNGFMYVCTYIGGERRVLVHRALQKKWEREREKKEGLN